MADKKLDPLQGTLDVMVLQTLSSMGPRHGYGIARRAEQASGNQVLQNLGTICASLVRLQQRGWIAAEWGTMQMATDTAHWLRLAGVMTLVLAPGGEEAK